MFSVIAQKYIQDKRVIFLLINIVAVTKWGQMMMSNNVQNQAIESWRWDDQGTSNVSIQKEVQLSSLRGPTFHRQNPPFRVADSERSIALLHVGKAAGSSVANQLRNACHGFLGRKPCKGKNITNETAVSLRTRAYFHVDEIIPYEDFTSFIVTARNPIERAISAFIFSHPANVDIRKQEFKNASKAERGIMKEPNRVKGPERLHYSCFPSLESFALSMAGNNTLTTRVKEGNGEYLNCTEVARDAISGKNPHFGHLHRNYNFFVGDMPLGKEIFVIRQEHLWGDFRKINTILGGGSNFAVPGSGRNHVNAMSNLALPVTPDLSSEGREVLCRHLEKELDVYMGLLVRAVNLSDEDIIDTVKSALEICPGWMM